MSDENVNRCDCINMTFAHLMEKYATLEAAQEATGCGLECEGCLPYLKLAYATGQYEINIDDPRADDYA
jgi:hypothetical protein